MSNEDEKEEQKQMQGDDSDFLEEKLNCKLQKQKDLEKEFPNWNQEENNMKCQTTNYRTIKAKSIYDDKFYVLKEIQIFENDYNPNGIINDINQSLDLNHGNILKYHEIFDLDEVEKEGIMGPMRRIVLKCDFMDWSLQKEIDSRKEKGYPKFYEMEVLFYMQECIDALLYLKTKKHINHLNLNPSNLLVNNTQQSFTIKISDFSIARKRKNKGGTCTLTKRQIGTAGHYNAPEIARAIFDDQALGLFNPEKCDVYSLGIIFLVLLCNPSEEQLLKFNDIENDKDRQKWREVKCLFDSPFFVWVIQNMTHRDVDKRWDLNQLNESLHEGFVDVRKHWGKIK